MIPVSNDNLVLDFEIEEQETITYKMDMVGLRIKGFVDGLQAMKQVIHKILNTERYDFLIYSWNYGVELTDLIGEQPSFAYPEIKRRIIEALIQDERITGVDEFTFTSTRDAVNVKFTVHTIEGDIDIEKAVTG
jgi:phage baseplate assembly protein W